jgi:RimJ/RimL family protein N-acetyltransferase
MVNSSKVRLCPKNLGHALNDYNWKKDTELARLVDTPPTTITFSDYLLYYISQLRHSGSTRHEFAIETLDGRHIGNCVCFNISETGGETEIGIMIGDRGYWGKGYGADALSAILDYAFGQMNLSRIHLKTLVSNERAQRCFGKCGFIPCGNLVQDGNSFILMELYRSRWQQYSSVSPDGQSNHNPSERNPKY